MEYDLKDCWAVLDHSLEPDTRNGGTMMRVTFANIATAQTADTYVCPANRNSRNWFEVLGLLEGGLIVAGVRTISRRGRTLISADSKPVIIWSGDPDQLFTQLAQTWQPKNNFGDLFE